MKHCIIPPQQKKNNPWLKCTTNCKPTFAQEIETNILEERGRKEKKKSCKVGDILKGHW